ncbi:MAG: hypothetical protein ACRD92_01225 [Nitrosopumilaceae archaeon]
MKMAHSEHNRPKKSGSFVLILFGAFLFISSVLFFERGSDLGKIVIILGFVIGGIGFYLGFVRKKRGT